MNYGDACLEVDGQRLHPDQLVQDNVTELIMVLLPALSVWEIPPAPPPASRQGVPSRSEGATASSQVPPLRRRPRHQLMLAQRWAHFPSTTEWSLLLHMDATTRPWRAHPRIGRTGRTATRYFAISSASVSAATWTCSRASIACSRGMPHSCCRCCTRGHWCPDGLERMRAWTVAPP